MSNETEAASKVTYILLQVIVGPSLLCDVLIFIYFVRRWHKEIVHAPQNHVIFSLLVTSFIQKATDVQFHLYYLRSGTVPVHTYAFCAIWALLNYALFTISIHLVTWCCIERHFFIFHSQMMKKRVCLICFHYIPLFLCLSYITFFDFAYIFFPGSCTNEWDYSLAYCGAPCYTYSYPSLAAFDWLFHCAIPVLLMVIANVLFFFRVLWHKLQRQHRIEWHRQRRLIIQLLFVSGLFLILASPQIIVGTIQSVWEPTFLSDVQNDYFFPMGSFMNQFLPFVIMGSLPKLKDEVKCWIDLVRRIVFRRQRRIQPAFRVDVTEMNGRTVNKTYGVVH